MTIWQPRLRNSGPRYLALVEALDADLAEGRLRPGDRLPPQRQLAGDLGVSLGTVTRAYAEAERRGLAWGEVGRGTFAGRRAVEDRFGTPPSGAIDLAHAWPLHALDPDLGAALRTVADRTDVGRLLEYGPNEGHWPHRAAGVLWASAQGIPASPERVVVCVGAQQAMHAVLGTLMEPGGVLLTEPVTYPGLRAVAAALHLRIVALPMDAEGIIPDAFDRACEARRPGALYTIPTIQNPTGRTLAEGRRREIADIARRHGVPIVEDEVHRLLSPEPPPAFSALAPELTFSILSLSKVVAGGLRIAFLVVPEGRATEVGRRIWATTWMAPPLMAEVASLWVHDGTALDTALRKRREAAERQVLAARELGGHHPGAAPHAYHIWLPLPGHWRLSDFALACERRGVAVSPSTTFAVSRAELDHAVRLSVVGPRTREELGRGLRVVAELLETRFPTVALV